MIKNWRRWGFKQIINNNIKKRSMNIKNWKPRILGILIFQTSLKKTQTFRRFKVFSHLNWNLNFYSKQAEMDITQKHSMINVILCGMIKVRQWWLLKPKRVRYLVDILTYHGLLPISQYRLPLVKLKASSSLCEIHKKY